MMEGLGWTRVPIPPAFHSDATGEPFDACIECERPLRTGGVPYVIEKAMRTYAPYGVTDTAFEYAMCLPCYQALSDQFSEASKRDIARYLAAAPVSPITDRAAWLEGGAPVDLDRWLGACAVKGTPVGDLDEYQIAAFCNGDHLVVAEFPALFSGAAIDELATLLSSETLDLLGGFRDKHFDLPPDLKKIGPDLVLL